MFVGKLAVFTAALLLPQFAVMGATPAKPNIVFILADDLGYTDIACYGSKYYETPNIDRLAHEGMRFTNGYTCGPNCQPTRAALMSGQYGPRTGVYTVGSIDRFDWRSRPLRPADNSDSLPAEKVIVAKALKDAGYVTGMFGKWHLGNGEEYHPGKRGFDEAIVSQGQHFNFNTRPITPYAKGTYLADFLTDKAEAFIRRHKDESFFLYLPHFGVHSPHEAKKELIERFRTKKGTEGHDNPTYAAMIASVDESVGRIMKLLKELNLEENTLVIFSSDNGGVGGYARAGIETKDEITDNAPLRGGKGMLYEGGIRVPYIFRWPGTIPAGKESDEPILSVDLYPTLLSVADATPPPNQPLDGLSYLELLKSGGRRLERDALYWHFPGYLGAGTNDWRTKPVGVIREGDWKLMEFFEDGKLELYNLKSDLSETKDLSAQEPERVKALHAKLQDWRTSIHAPMPTKNEPGADASPKKEKKEKRQGKKKRNRRQETDE